MYTISTTTRLAGAPAFQTGDNFGLSGNVSYNFTDQLSSVLSGTYTHTSNNFKPNPVLNTLFEEIPNSNSDLYRLGLDTTYKFSDTFSGGPLFSWMYRDRNAFLPGTLLFVPASVRWAAGAAFNFTLSNTISATARVEHIWTSQNTIPDLNLLGILQPGTGTISLSTTGWALAGGITIRF